MVLFFALWSACPEDGVVSLFFKPPPAWDQTKDLTHVYSLNHLSYPLVPFSFIIFFQAALSNTGIPKVQVAADASSTSQPEVDVSDEEYLQFDTSGVPVVVTLTKVSIIMASVFTPNIQNTRPKPFIFP